MALREEFEATGNWLFRWRSYLPVLMVFVVLLGIESDRETTLDSDVFLYDFPALCLSFIGLALRAFVVGYKPKGTSGRNTRNQVADVLNTKDMYSIARHPLYLGNFIIWTGISLIFHTWWMTALVILIFWLYYERIAFAEEEFLRKKFGDQYLRWAARTPAFLPAPRNWQSSGITFSWKKVLGKEYAGFFAVIFSVTVLKIIIGLFENHQIALRPVWIWLFGSGLCIYVALRFLKKRTRLLDTPNR